MGKSPWDLIAGVGSPKFLRKTSAGPRDDHTSPGVTPRTFRTQPNKHRGSSLPQAQSGAVRPGGKSAPLLRITRLISVPRRTTVFPRRTELCVEIVFDDEFDSEFQTFALAVQEAITGKLVA